MTNHPLLEARQLPQQTFFRQEGERLAVLAREGQSPRVLFIGCVDSRVTPEQIFGLRPGEWLMVRNVGNVVPPYSQVDIGMAGALEFAVLVLQVAHIIVCGHTDCGGMKAVLAPPLLHEQPGLARWTHIARPALLKIDLTLPETQQLDSLVQENVRLQLAHLRTYPYIRAAEAAGRLHLHGWIYDLAAPAVWPLEETAGR
jgi:carbonic anhydrase